MNKDSLGDRMKKYEKVYFNTLTHKLPLIIRVDGKAFHTFTKKMEKPFDVKFMLSMATAAAKTAQNMQGFKMAYVQSDEATFCLTDYDKLETQGWFGYELPKVISISASLMTANFIKSYITDISKSEFYSNLPIFDSRAFVVPKEEVANVFLWRAKDWQRNSLQMYCRSFFSHKELHGKNHRQLHEMLYGIGKNWSKDLTSMEKNGTFIYKGEKGWVGMNQSYTIKPTYEAINELVERVGILR